MGVLSSTPRTWVASEIVTAAELNAEVRDPITAMEAAWGTWTPTITGITLGTGSNTVARYNQIGKTILFEVQITLGTGGAVTTSVTFTLPVTASRINWQSADVGGFDSSVPATYSLVGLCTSTTIMTVRAPGASANGPLVATGAAVPFTWAVGDILTISGRYEAA